MKIQKKKGKILIFGALLLCLVCGSLTACGIANGKQRFTITSAYGIDGKVQNGCYAPVEVTVTNQGRDFVGTVQIIAYDGTDRVMYEKDVSIGAGASKTVKLTIPFVSRNGQYNIRIVNSRDTVLATKLEKYTAVSSLSNVNVGILSDDYSALGYMDGQTLLGNSDLTTKIYELTAEDISSDWKALDMLNIIVVADYSTDQLADEQISALRFWVDNGGILITATGSTANKTLAKFNNNLYSLETGSLITVSTKLATEHFLDDNSTSYSQSGESDDFSQWLYDLGDTATQKDSYSDYYTIAKNAEYVDVNYLPFTLNSEQDVSYLYAEDEDGAEFALAAYIQQEGGYYIITNCDLTKTPVMNYDGAGLMFLEMIESCMDSLYSDVAEYNSNYGTYYSYYSSYNSNIFSLYSGLEAAKAPSLLLYGLILIGYVVAVPITFFILKRKKKNTAMWLALPIIVAATTLVLYIAGFATRLTKTELGVAKILELTENKRINETDYISVTMPNNKATSVSFNPQSNLSLHTNDTDYYYYTTNTEVDLNSYDYAIKSSATEYEVEFQNHMALGSENLVLESDKSAGGGVDITLHYANSTIGDGSTITNGLDYDLTGAAIFLSSEYIFIGDIKAGETVSLDQLTPKSWRGYYGSSTLEEVKKRMIPGKQPNTITTLLFGSLGSNYKKYAVADAALDYIINSYCPDYNYYGYSYGFEDATFIAFPDVEETTVQGNKKYREYSESILYKQFYATENYGNTSVWMVEADQMAILSNIGTGYVDLPDAEDGSFSDLSSITISYEIGEDADSIRLLFDDNIASYFCGTVTIHNFATGQETTLCTLDDNYYTYDSNSYNDIYDTGTLNLSEYPDAVSGGRIQLTFTPEQYLVNGGYVIHLPVVYCMEHSGEE